MKNRQQKISFLKGLVKGQRTINELAEEKTLIFYETGMETGLFTKFDEFTLPGAKIYTRAEIDVYSERHPRDSVLLFTQQAGYEPLEVEKYLDKIRVQPPDQKSHKAN